MNWAEALVITTAIVAGMASIPLTIMACAWAQKRESK